MKVKDIMTIELFTLRSDHTLDLAEDIMTWQNIRHIPIVNRAYQLVGILTHRDLLRASLSNLADASVTEQRHIFKNLKIGDLMRKKIRTTSPGSDLREVAAIMMEEKIGCLPVVQGKKLVGIITEADFMRLAWETLDRHLATKSAPSTISRPAMQTKRRALATR